MFKKFREFFASDAYENDPYGYLTNQIGHMVLGCYLMTMVMAFTVFFITGMEDYPSQIPFVIALCFAYIFVWEVGIQGWNGIDTVEDCMYFCMGASLWLFIEFDIVLERLTVWSLVFTVLLFVGFYARLKALPKEGNK
jgi:hypothetical protein